MAELIEEILDHWFGDMTPGDGVIAERQAPLWWQADAGVDADLASRYGAILARARDGELDHWADSPRGRLALIIVLDQFSRCIHRDEPHAFAQDHLALAHSLQAQTRQQPASLRPVERIFIYMPMEHAEALMVQDESVHRFEALRDEVDEESRPGFETLLEFARRHRDIILRFGRFPHRNEILGRESTPAEIEHLRTVGRGF